MKKKIILITALLLTVLVLSLLIASAFSFARSEPENFVGGGSSGGSSNSSSDSSSGGDTENGTESGDSAGGDHIVNGDASEGLIVSADDGDVIFNTENNLLNFYYGQRSAFAYDAEGEALEISEAVIVSEDNICFLTDNLITGVNVGSSQPLGGLIYAFFYTVDGDDTFHLIDENSIFKVLCSGYTSDDEDFTGFSFPTLYYGWENVNIEKFEELYLTDTCPSNHALPSSINLYLFAGEYYS